MARSTGTAQTLEAIRRQAIALYQNGASQCEIAQQLGRSRGWVSTTIKDWKTNGDEVLAAQRRKFHCNLTSEQLAEVQTCLLRGPIPNKIKGHGPGWKPGKLSKLLGRKMGIIILGCTQKALMEHLGWRRDELWDGRFMIGPKPDLEFILTGVVPTGQIGWVHPDDLVERMRREGHEQIPTGAYY